MSETMNQLPNEHHSDPVHQRRALLAGIGGLAAGAVLAGRAHAGPLSPPAGPIAPTPGPEPRIAINETNTPGDAESIYKITQPGSYYLTGNITGAAGKHGIVIAASDVSLDLMGFELAGIPGMGAFDGIRVAATGLTNIEIRDGSVRDWGKSGVDLQASVGVSSRVLSVRAAGNPEFGIRVGPYSEVTGCVASTNLFGIWAGIAARIDRCTASQNTRDGITANRASIVSECVASGNGGDGITAYSESRVCGCVTNNNAATGMVTGSNSMIVECSATANGGDGINVNSSSTIHRCFSSGNAGDGLQSIGPTSSIIGCTSVANAGNGITTIRQCLVESNYCTGNGLTTFGAGIRTDGYGTKIVNNQCMGNAIGIQVDDAGNLITANTCGGNVGLNWFIAASNSCLVMQATTTGAISGNTGGTSPGSTNPNANYTY